jgi:hypothetical protein
LVQWHKKAATPQENEMGGYPPQQMKIKDAVDDEDISFLFLCAPHPSAVYFHRRRHERKLNTINENPQITQMTQILPDV